MIIDELFLNEGIASNISRLGLLGAAIGMQSSETPLQPTTPVDNNYALSKDEMTLAKTIWGEARGEGIDGMTAVGNVIKNRVKSNEKKFGYGYSGVITKNKQFSCWNSNDPNYNKLLNLENLKLRPHDAIRWDQAKIIAKNIFSGKIKDNTNGSVYYHTNSITPYWSKNLKPVKAISNHFFYNDI